MANAPKANAVVGQSGGPTGVINASLVGVIEEAKKHPEIENLYGAIHAVAGMVKEDFIDLNALSEETLKAVATSPSSAIGTSRDRPDQEYCAKIFEVFKKRNIRYFFYIGGNDSANTAHIINKMASESGYELRAFHIPKTVDNDLLVTDHCPGYGTAARFVSCALIGDDLDNRALAGVKIDCLMGRHAGFLTAAGGAVTPSAGCCCATWVWVGVCCGILKRLAGRVLGGADERSFCLRKMTPPITITRTKIPISNQLLIDPLAFDMATPSGMC